MSSTNWLRALLINVPWGLGVGLLLTASLAAPSDTEEFRYR